MSHGTKYIFDHWQYRAETIKNRFTSECGLKISLSFQTKGTSTKCQIAAKVKSDKINFVKIKWLQGDNKYSIKLNNSNDEIIIFLGYFSKIQFERDICRIFESLKFSCKKK